MRCGCRRVSSEEEGERRVQVSRGVRGGCRSFARRWWALLKSYGAMTYRRSHGDML